MTTNTHITILYIVSLSLMIAVGYLFWDIVRMIGIMENFAAILKSVVPQLQ